MQHLAPHLSPFLFFSIDFWIRTPFFLSFPLGRWKAQPSSSLSSSFSPFPIFMLGHMEVSSSLSFHVPRTLRRGHFCFTLLCLLVLNCDSTGPLRVYGAGRRVGQSLSDVTLSWFPSPSSAPPHWTLLLRCLRFLSLLSFLLCCVGLTVSFSRSCYIPYFLWEVHMAPTRAFGLSPGTASVNTGSTSGTASVLTLGDHLSLRC